MQIKCAVLPSFAKLLPDEKTAKKHYRPQSFSCLKGEKLRFLLAVFSNSKCSLRLTAVSSEETDIYEIGCVPVRLPVGEGADDYYISKRPGLYPDVLIPLRSDEIHVLPGQNTVFLFECSAEHQGEKTLKILLSDMSGALVSSETVHYTVLPVSIPKSDFICTHWFHTDCLCDEYGFEPFSDEYWKCVGNYMSAAAAHSINSLLVPLFTPPLDTAVGAERRTIQLVDVKLTDGGKYEFGFDKLRQWVKLADRSGLEYFEFSHFFTQWGAEHCPKIVADINGKSEIIFGWKDDSLGEDYYSFLSQLAAALKPVIRELGIEERCIFHVSDEPDTAHLQRYKACAAVIHDLFGEFKIIDALSNYSFYSSGAIRIPVPSVAHASEFYGKVEELWCYYCCGPIDGGYTNRFIAMPGTRTRALGIQAYKHNVRGFLHWGYNYWYTALSKYKINPYISPDADKSFPAGDGFVVYPGEELSPVLSLRLKIFDDAFNDLSALKLLESLLSREEVLSILEEKKEITFSKYPQTERGLFELRERINRAIGETIQTPQSN